MIRRREFTGLAAAGLAACTQVHGELKTDPDWSALPAETPANIRKLLRRCLERDRKRRLQDIGEARIAIESPEEEVSAAQLVVSHRWILWAAAAGVLAIVSGMLAVGWWRATQPMSRPLTRVSIELPLDTSLARVGSAAGPHLALSPDGTRLVVTVLGADGKAHLAMRLLEQSQFTSLSGTDGANSPIFSPDGQWIGFFADNKLKKIAVRGGAAIDLCDGTPQRRELG